MADEKTLKPVGGAPKMISVDEANTQMKALMTQANQKMQQLAIQVQNLDSMLRDKTIENLFKVLEYAHHFTGEFVDNCAKVITDYLTKVAIETPSEEQSTKQNASEKHVEEESQAETKGE